MCPRLRDETRKGCGAAAASGEVGGSQRQRGRLGVVKFGAALMAKAMKIVVATVGKLTSAADAAPSRTKHGCSSSPHLHDCLRCLPLLVLRPTLSDTSKYYFFIVILSIVAIYLWLCS